MPVDSRLFFRVQANTYHRTLFHTGIWPLAWDDVPINGWGSANVLQILYSEATSDVTGRLYCHIRSHVQAFHTHLAKKGANFEFYSTDAAELLDFLPKYAFARIEVRCMQASA